MLLLNRWQKLSRLLAVYGSIDSQFDAVQQLIIRKNHYGTKMQQPILIFTDGACSGNPGRGGWGAIIVRPEGEVVELGGYAEATTNNRMEMAATIHALNTLKNQGGLIHLHTDSVYVIRGITQWIYAWRRRSWKTAEGEEVANRDMWEILYEVVATGKQNKQDIQWFFIRGHSGFPGNERVDEIAVAFSKAKRIELYSGPLLRYSVPVHDLPESGELPEMKPKEEKKPAAFSYLSVVNGVVDRHLTWAECERRVKGVSGARFKKAMNEEGEQQILANWKALSLIK